jgi:hypothetical protein
MSKKQFTEFECDVCNKKIISTEFPYDKGWQYLYLFDGKVSEDNNIRQVSIKDRHFCGKECMIKFIKDNLTSLPRSPQT